MKHTAEKFFGASMVIIAELFLLLALLNSASLSLPLTHLFPVKFRPPFLYLVLCGKYKHTLKNTLMRVFYCVISNGVEVGRETPSGYPELKVSCLGLSEEESAGIETVRNCEQLSTFWLLSYQRADTKGLERLTIMFWVEGWAWALELSRVVQIFTLTRTFTWSGRSFCLCVWIRERKCDGGVRCRAEYLGCPDTQQVFLLPKWSEGGAVSREAPTEAGMRRCWTMGWECLFPGRWGELQWFRGLGLLG